MLKILILFAVLIFMISSVLAQVSQAPFSYVEDMPVFRGGTTAMNKFVFDNLVYPDTAIQNHIEGTVIAQYVVDIDSLAKEVKIVTGLGYGCDEEVLRLFELMNEQKLWIPGRHNNKPVPVIYTMPVRFVLHGKEQKRSKKSKKKD